MSHDSETKELQSCIYKGTVFHRRETPKVHQFKYSVFYMYFDLSELDEVFKGRWLWSTNRRTLARFKRKDFLNFPQVSLDEEVRDVVQNKTGTRPAGPIRLLTQIRYFGYIMNPLALYYCFDEAGEKVETVVAEVSNTPWDERHLYILKPDAETDSDTLETSHPKDFHVSPFMEMDMYYHWSLSKPSENLKASIESTQDGKKKFAASMSLSKKPITTAELSKALLWHPFMTGKIIAGIYWQALLLWWKRIPYVPHPKTKIEEKAIN